MMAIKAATNGTPTRAVVPYAEAALPTAGERDDLDAFGQGTPEELVLPTRVLVQGVSRKAEAARAGEFWARMTDTYYEGLRVAILGMRRSRSLFAEGAFDAPPVCSSEDAVKPREQVTVGDTTTGPTCAECPMSQWGTAREGKGKGQACRLSFNLLCYDLDNADIFVLRVSGTSIMPWRLYMTAGRLSPLAAYAVETFIASEQREFSAGKAYVLTFTRGKPVTDEVALALREQAAAHQGVSLGVQEEIEPEVNDAPPPDDESPFD